MDKTLFRFGITDPATHSRSAHRPTPDLSDGGLEIDPEISLSAKGFGLEIGFFYSTRVNTNRSIGQGRNMSVAPFIRHDTLLLQAGFYRGDLLVFPLSQISSSGSVTVYGGAAGTAYVNTISYDSNTNLMAERYLDGTVAT